jgi:hypothetical protein
MTMKRLRRATQHGESAKQLRDKLGLNLNLDHEDGA